MNSSKIKPPAKFELKLLFENATVLAYDKPAGTPSVPDRHAELDKTLLGAAQAERGTKLWGVQRADKGTSGVVIFAKNENAGVNILQQFRKGSVKKTYYVLVNGNPAQDAGTIDAPISLDGKNPALDVNGNAAATDYKVIERFRDFSLVEASTSSGGRHQIRLHFLSLGYPLAVDEVYSGRQALLLSEFKKRYKPCGIEKPLFARLSLHLKSVTFRDPDFNTDVTVESPLPHDFEITLKQLRKYNKC